MMRRGRWTRLEAEKRLGRFHSADDAVCVNDREPVPSLEAVIARQVTSVCTIQTFGSQ